MLSTWKPLKLPEVQALFAEFGAPWWIAGGLAIELVLGEPIRDHGDVDVFILRRDQDRLRGIMNDWDLQVADPSETIPRPWRDGERLETPINGVWCRPQAQAPWALEVLLDEARGEDWVSRRCAMVSRPLSSMGWFTANRVPILAAEIQLFYKAKDPRPQDECDFAAILPHLTSAQSRWLDDALGATFPMHPWRDRLHV